jgi:DNA excision repair protein ERCC-2
MTIEIPEEVKEIFPYKKVRHIQDKLINITYDALRNRKNVIIEGANGLGKTVATLTAALPIAREKDLQIIHVCRTNKQADRVISELKEIAKVKPASGISIRGRRDMCLHPLIEKHADDAVTASVLCGQLKKLRKCEFYNRMSESLPHLRNAMKQLKDNPASSADIQKLCIDYEICPYELILKAIENVEVIAASYQYLFNPNIRDIFINKVSRGMNELLLIVDECHNIISTSIDISSDQLTLFSAQQALKEVKTFGKSEFLRVIRALISILESYQQTKETEEKISASDVFIKLSQENGKTVDFDFAEKMISAGMQVQKHYANRNKPPRSYIFRMGRFLQKMYLTRSRPEFLHLASNYRTRRGGWGVRLEAVSLDARYTTRHVFENVYNSVHISGTIEPIDAYSRLVGMNKLPLVTEVLDSPYSEKNVQGYVVSDFSTKLNDRTPENYLNMCQVIGEVVNNTPANTGIFTASYIVLDSLLDAGIETCINKPLFYETRKMTSKANDQIVNEFKELSSKGGAALLGVLGGRSSEGADFPGEQMNTCIIVGIPYARPTTRVQSQIDYLDEQFDKRGREYGYVIPAMRRASQAAGRPIRSINDKGLIIFLDYRFGHNYTARYLPVWLRENTQLLKYRPGIMSEITQEFYS